MDFHRRPDPERVWGITAPGALRDESLMGLCLCLLLSQCAGNPASGEGKTTPTPHPPEKLQQLLHYSRERNRPYQTPTIDELRKFEAAGRTLLAQVVLGPRCEQTVAATVDVARQLQAVQFELVPTQLGGAPAISVRESPLRRRGGGVYVFRLGAVPRERLVQVPHSFFDIGTLEIGSELARIAQARALVVNTVHRYQGARFSIGEEEDQGEAPADLTHQRLTFFQAFTFAALATMPQLQVVQVHGFADGAVPDCPQAEVVVSAGAASAGEQEAAQVARQLARLLGQDRVFLYPRDTRKLGARTNIQGRTVALTSCATFLHLELSRTLRGRLLLDAGLLRAFVAAVIAPQVGIP